MTDEKLNNLKRLYNNGILTKPEYNKLVKELQLNTNLFQEVSTWKDVVDNLQVYCDTVGLSETTSYLYKRVITSFARFLNSSHSDNSSLDTFHFNEYTKQDIQEYAIYLKNEMELNSKTLNKYRFAFLCTSRFLLNLGYDVPYVEIDDIEELNEYTPNYKKEYTLFYEDDILEIAMHSPLRDRLIILLAFYCGLKRAQIIELEFSDFKKFSLNVKGDRTYVMPKILYDTFYDYKQWFNIESQTFKREIDTDYVFQSRKTNKPTYNVITTVVNRAVNYYSIKKGVVFGYEGKIRARNFKEHFTIENIRKSGFAKQLSNMTTTEFCERNPSINKDIVRVIGNQSLKMY